MPPVYDLNVIPSHDVKKDQGLLVQMAKLGYHGITWNIVTNKVPSARDEDIVPYKVEFEADDPLYLELERVMMKNNFLTTQHSNYNKYYTTITQSRAEIENEKSNTLYANLMNTVGLKPKVNSEEIQSQNDTKIETTMTDDDDDNKTTTTNPTTTPLPPSSSSSLTPIDPPQNLKPALCSFQQMTRITLQVDEMSQQFTQALNFKKAKAGGGSKLSQFDLIAISPGSDKVLHQVLFNDLCDIISFDLTKRLPFIPKGPLISLAVENGIYFELDISPLFLTPRDVNGGRPTHDSSSSATAQPGQDVTMRRLWLAQLQTFLHCTGGKNLIITSGTNCIAKCHSLNELKLLLIGVKLPYKDIEEYTYHNVIRVIEHSMTRDVNKGVLQFTLIPKYLRNNNNTSNNNEGDNNNNKKNKNNNHNNNFKSDRNQNDQDNNKNNNKKQRNNNNR